MTDKTQRNENILRRQVFPIPGVPAPVGTRCITLHIPDHDDHEAILMGALDLLCKWNSWERDDDNNALLASEAWKRAIYDNPAFERCEPMFQLRQFDDCTLQQSTDGGETWTDIFNASGCVAQGILDAIDSGTVAPGGQQPPGGGGTPGQCYTYHVKLDGNGRWISPIAIGYNDTITISNAQGAWWSGELLETWACPNGDIYTLGNCTGATMGTAPSDPLPTLDHMRLIGNLPDDTVPFFDLFNTTYTVNGSTAQNLIIQTNDSDLSDNDGSVTFDIEICKDAGWCYTITAANGLGTLFTAQPNGSFNGTNWEPTYWSAIGDYAINIGMDLPAGRYTYFAVELNTTWGGANNLIRIYESAGSGGALLAASVGTDVITGVDLTTAALFYISSAGITWQVVSVTMHGIGVNPFGSNNC